MSFEFSLGANLDPLALAATEGSYAALRSCDLRLLLASTFLAVVGEQMLGVAIGWERLGEMVCF